MLISLETLTANAEHIIADSGRTSRGKRSNISMEDDVLLVRKMLTMGHHSVLEHASATVRVSGISRAFTHQLVRHRLCSFTQQSQRYATGVQPLFIEPDSVSENADTHELYRTFLQCASTTYDELLKQGVPQEDARFVLPNATTTEIVVTANFREWRHIIELRGALDSQWEIRRFAIEVLKILMQHAPSVFDDLLVSEDESHVYKCSPNKPE